MLGYSQPAITTILVLFSILVLTLLYSYIKKKLGKPPIALPFILMISIFTTTMILMSILMAPRYITLEPLDFKNIAMYETDNTVYIEVSITCIKNGRTLNNVSKYRFDKIHPWISLEFFQSRKYLLENSSSLIGSDQHSVLMNLDSTQYKYLGIIQSEWNNIYN